MHNVTNISEDRLEVISPLQISEGDSVVIPSECAVYHVEGNLARIAGVTSFDATYHAGSRVSRILLCDHDKIWRVRG